MKESDRSPRWWSIYEAAVTGLACGGGCANVVEEATSIADLSLDEGTPKLMEMSGVVQKVERRRSHTNGDPLVALVALGEDTLSFQVPPAQQLQPGDKVLCSVTAIN